MSREIMQQALDMLVEPHPHTRTSFTDSIKYREKINQVIEALRQALAQPAQVALDKKADNARELGLDYKPEQAPSHSATHSTDSAEGFGKPEQAGALPPTANAVYWMDMVVANLVRNGVNKHRARELAHHFYTYTTPTGEQA